MTAQEYVDHITKLFEESEMSGSDQLEELTQHILSNDCGGSNY